jgi:hypothetical protein
MGSVITGLGALLGSEALATSLVTGLATTGLGAAMAPDAPEAPDASMQTSTTVGTGPETTTKSFEGEAKRETAIDKKKRGTKSLQIPLQTPQATTSAAGINTNAASGLMI